MLIAALSHCLATVTVGKRSNALVIKMDSGLKAYFEKGAYPKHNKETCVMDVGDLCTRKHVRQFAGGSGLVNINLEHTACQDRVVRATVAEAIDT